MNKIEEYLLDFTDYKKIFLQTNKDISSGINLYVKYSKSSILFSNRNKNIKFSTSLNSNSIEDDVFKMIKNLSYFSLNFNKSFCSLLFILTYKR